MIHSFTCTKCQKRFISRDECRRHIIQHLKSEKLAQAETLSESIASSSDATKALSENATVLPEDLKQAAQMDEFDEELLSSYICENSGTSLGNVESSVVDQVVSEIHEELARRNSHKEEKHSHTVRVSMIISCTIFCYSCNRKFLERLHITPIGSNARRLCPTSARAKETLLRSKLPDARAVRERSKRPVPGRTRRLSTRPDHRH